MCREFLENCREAHEQGKAFHYAWILLSIVLVAWEFLEDNQFQTIAKDIMEAMKYALLWETKDAQRIRENKIFWVFMEMNIRMWINCKSRLSPTIYNSLQSFTEFKADFNHVYIRARKEPMNKWNELHYLTMNDVIFTVLDSWPLEWHAQASSMVEPYKYAEKRKREEAKLWMAQLAEKRRNEAVKTEVQEACDAAKAATEQQQATEKEHEVKKLPSPE